MLAASSTRLAGGYYNGQSAGNQCNFIIKLQLGSSETTHSTSLIIKMII